MGRNRIAAHLPAQVMQSGGVCAEQTNSTGPAFGLGRYEDTWLAKDFEPMCSLYAVRKRGHDPFRPLSRLNTPLFVGFQASSPSCGWRTMNMASILYRAAVPDGHEESERLTLASTS